jgi:hypothetical protein
MVFIPTYSTNNVDEILANAGNGPLPLITPGDYKAVIVKSELKDTDKGGKILNLTFIITEGQHKDTELVERLNVVNTGEKKATVERIAFETLARIAKAAGLSTMPADSTALHNKPMVIKVKTEAGKPWTDKDGQERAGSDKSVIDSKGYANVPSAGIAPAAASAAYEASAAMPWQK